MKETDTQEQRAVDFYLTLATEQAKRDMIATLKAPARDLVTVLKHRVEQLHNPVYLAKIEMEKHYAGISTYGEWA